MVVVGVAFDVHCLTRCKSGEGVVDPSAVHSVVHLMVGNASGRKSSVEELVGRKWKGVERGECSLP